MILYSKSEGKLLLPWDRADRSNQFPIFCRFLNNRILWGLIHSHSNMHWRQSENVGIVHIWHCWGIFPHMVCRIRFFWKDRCWVCFIWGTEDIQTIMLLEKQFSLSEIQLFHPLFDRFRQTFLSFLLPI